MTGSARSRLWWHQLTSAVDDVAITGIRVLFCPRLRAAGHHSRRHRRQQRLVPRLRRHAIFKVIFAQNRARTVNYLVAFTCVTLRQRGSESMSVCYKSKFYRNDWTDRAGFGAETSCDLFYVAL